VTTAIIEDAAVLAGGGVQRDQLVTSLGQREEEREQNRAHQEPAAELHVDREGPGHRPENEAEGDGEHVEDDDVLEAERVGEVQDDVGRSRGSESGTEGQRGAQTGHEKQGRGEPGRPYRQGAAGQRAKSLPGMEAVTLEVREVVDEVHGPGECTEHQERQAGAQDGIRLEQVLGERQRGQNHQVLGPLVGPERDEERAGLVHRPPFRAAPVARADLDRPARHRIVTIRTCSC
jgi:hypothetical protein